MASCRVCRVIHAAASDDGGLGPDDDAAAGLGGTSEDGGPGPEPADGGADAGDGRGGSVRTARPGSTKK